MADQLNRDRAPLADQAEARTTGPAALNEKNHPHHDHDHHRHDHDDHDDEDGHDHEHPFEWQESPVASTTVSAPTSAPSARPGLCVRSAGCACR